MAAINPRKFLNTTDELHALVIGLCEVLCPWPPSIKTMSRKIGKELAKEYHYYVLGRAAGILAWLGLAAAIKKIFF